MLRHLNMALPSLGAMVAQLAYSSLQVKGTQRDRRQRPITEEVQSSHKDKTNMGKVVSQKSSMSMCANYPSGRLSVIVTVPQWV